MKCPTCDINLIWELTGEQTAVTSIARLRCPRCGYTKAEGWDISEITPPEAEAHGGKGGGRGSKEEELDNTHGRQDTRLD